MGEGRHTSLTTAAVSAVPKAFLRSPAFATSPLETLTKTLLIWSTSSRSLSLHGHVGALIYGRSDGSGEGEEGGDGHAVAPFLDLVLVACDLRGRVAMRAWGRAQSTYSPTSNRFPPFLRRTTETFVSLRMCAEVNGGQILSRWYKTDFI